MLHPHVLRAPDDDFQPALDLGHALQIMQQIADELTDPIEGTDGDAIVDILPDGSLSIRYRNGVVDHIRYEWADCPVSCLADAAVTSMLGWRARLMLDRRDARLRARRRLSRAR